MFKAVVHYMLDTNSIEVFDYETFEFEHMTNESSFIRDEIRETIQTSHGQLRDIIQSHVQMLISPEHKPISCGSDIFASVQTIKTIEVKPDQQDFYVDFYAELWGFASVLTATPNNAEEYDYLTDIRDHNCKFIEDDIAHWFLRQTQLELIDDIEDMDYGDDI